MEITPELLAQAHHILARANSTSSTTQPSRPPVYKAIGLTLAISSGVFIGTSFVLKKTGLLKANAKYNEEAGEGYGYLKNAYWWTGMTLMIIGEICNFVAYAFVDAILVTPLGALSVVVTTILSTIFLKERLSFVGKVGCFNCIVGSVVIVMNAPQQSSVATIQDMKHFVLAPGFLSYAGVIIVGCAVIAVWVGPRYGKKSMLVYLSICSLIGGLSVVATQGLGAAVVAQASGKPQFNQWFLYVLLAFVITTLVTEIIFLNVSYLVPETEVKRLREFPQKALNIFNAALVTPTYYVFFTSATIVTSAILFQGFKGTPTSIATVIMGFLQICAGVVLLQLSKSAKDVPDAAVFKGDLDQVREVAEQEQPETEPKADAIRGTAAIIRRLSGSRQKMEQEEARRLREDKLKDQLEPLRENEVVEWDGLRRRKTIIGNAEPGSPIRRKTVHPPLGMSHFPEQTETGDQERDARESHGFFEGLRERLHPQQHRNTTSDYGDQRSPVHPMPLTEINVQGSKPDTPILPYGPGSFEEAQEHIYGLPPPRQGRRNQTGNHSPRSKPLPNHPPDQSPALGGPSKDNLAPEPPEYSTRRQFSFTNVFHRHSKTPERPSSSDPNIASTARPTSRIGLGSRSASSTSHEQKRAMKSATEEERLGLVKGDSHAALLQEEHSLPHPTHSQSSSSTSESFIPYDLKPSNYVQSSEDDEDDDWQMMNSQSIHPSQSPPRRLPQHEQSPPPTYQTPSPPRRIIAPTRTVFNPSQTSALKPATNLPPATYTARNEEDPGARNASPEDYEESKRKFVQQRARDRGPDDDTGGGAGNTTSARAFI